MWLAPEIYRGFFNLGKKEIVVKAMPYSLEEYRTAFERVIGFIMGHVSISSISEYLWYKVDKALDAIKNIEMDMKSAETLQELYSIGNAISEVYDELSSVIGKDYDKDEKWFVEDYVGTTYLELLLSIDRHFEEFNITHIANVLGLGTRDVMDIWFEGFTNADAMALEYYRTVDAVLADLEEIYRRIYNIVEYEYDYEFGEAEEVLLSREHRQELKQLAAELDRLWDTLLIARDYAKQLETAAREDAINTLLFFLEEIEKKITSKA